MGALTREGVKAMGLELLCEDERFASDTVTAVKCPEGVEVSELRTLMEDEYGVVLAGGQAKLRARSSASATWGWWRRTTSGRAWMRWGRRWRKLGYRAA